MPIQAGLPIIDVPPTGPVGPDYTDSRTLALCSIDGLNLWPFQGREFVARQGLSGLNLAPRSIVEEPVPGMAGTRLREIRVEKREVFLPIFLASDLGHAKFLDRRDELTRLLTTHGIDYAAHDGTLNLVANSLRGERYLRCYYVSGYEGLHAIDSGGSFWESIGLTLHAARPYWYGEPWLTQYVKTSTGVQWFPDFPGELTSGRVLGTDIPVHVGGDIPSWPSLEIGGPASSITISGPGLMMSIPDGVAPGSTATIVTEPRGRTALFDGVKNWARVAPTDRYAPLNPGASLINVVMTGTNADSFARIGGESRYERPW